ncbi:Rox3 mediator complex subunit-domain-containing protein [Pseudomassariella vexata]|uniref:Mediator of RNA polymerase II transcription subunit 19 n=1 Tax=Pseudomassariella vexata TaxID=1141098 RepID=A0A1Y2EJH2_9PEZI|nr:Rox3 mediator complex subunit-domain-containing protein [Pseudomassariella vexata]ORY71718.1 Rox3 mediator complex subunit-domain-containing protein [Pseudomassariella vexata]
MAAMSFNPQTPQSPSQFSPSTADALSSMNTSMTSVTTSLPTPAHSISGSTTHDTMMTDADSPHKRKRMPDDMGDHEQKKVHLEDPRRLGIENLHLDVGEKYLLCRTPYSMSLPRTSGDLFEMFGLTGIAAEVARTKPNGEKNALRKTYKGHIKTLGVNGQFEAVKKEPDDPNGLMFMLHLPQEDWYNTEVRGNEIERGFSDQVQSSLLKATSMAKGPIPKNEWDSAVLGDLAPSNISKKTNQDAASRTPGTPLANTGVPKSGKTQLAHIDRARRNIKKRSYQDSSFEGYGDGFDEDQGAETGYSTGENDDRSSKQKRRKQNSAGGSSFTGGMRQQGGYGGVGS